jgi:hypothetical protein
MGEAEEITKICPFLSMVMERHKKPYHFCIEEHCGIWTEEGCSLRVIPEKIKDLVGTLTTMGVYHQ